MGKGIGIIRSKRATGEAIWRAKWEEESSRSAREGAQAAEGAIGKRERLCRGRKEGGGQ
jgi:hypothetical protein